MSDVKRLLDSIYFSTSNAAGFSSVNRLYHAAQKQNKNITLESVQDYLNGNATYTKFAPVKRIFQKNKWLPTFIDSHHHADLAFFNKLSKFNKGFNYLLVVVDVLSRFIWVEPVRSKKAHEVTRAFESILVRSHRQPVRFITDQGGEFCNGVFRAMLKTLHIVHIIPKNTDVKAGFAENAIMRIKNKLLRYFDAQNTFIWIDVIQQIVQSLNNTFMVSIGMAPSAMTPENCLAVVQRIESATTVKLAVFKVGDVVRISRAISFFTKGTAQKYSEELFTVKKVIFPLQTPCFILQDWAGEEIDAFFYPEELHLYTPAKDEAYPIEKVLRKRQHKGITQYFVKFRGYPDKFNSWVDQCNVKLPTER